MEQLVQHIFSQNIAQALCQTFIHSLWEGLLLAVVAGLIILLTRRSKATLRYHLLIVALLLYTAAISLTFVLALNPGTEEIAGSAAAHINGQNNFIAFWTERFNDLLKSAHEHAGIVTGIWLLLVGLQNLRLIFGIYTLERLKKVRVKPAGMQWQKKTAYLSKVLGVKPAVSLLESAIVKVPMVIGFLKPVVLIPVGLVNLLDPEQVEAILMHELAHIRRNDYLVNILQTILEIFFFFNPAVLWLSRQIRTERENCCDDVVIAHTQNQVGYIKALVCFEEYRLASPRHAVALSGVRAGMVERLERILTGKNRSLGKLELIVLGAILVLSTVFIAASPRNTVSSLLKTPAPAATSSASKSQETKKKAEAAERTRHKEPSP